MGTACGLVSNGFNPRNRLNTGVWLKSLVLVGAKNLVDAILGGRKGGTHTRWVGKSNVELDGGVLQYFEWWPFKKVALSLGGKGRLMESVPHPRAACMLFRWSPS